MEPSPRAVRNTVLFLVIAGTILWIPIVLQILRGGAFLGNLGFVSGPRGTASAWVLAAVVAIGYTGFTLKRVPLVATYAWHVSWLKGLGVLAAVGAALVEEAAFRRELMDAVQGAGGSPVVQVLASGIAFGLAHGLWGIVIRDFRIGLRIVYTTSALGAALAVVYLVGGRSLAPVIVAHFVITATIQPGILLFVFSETGRSSDTHKWVNDRDEDLASAGDADRHL